MNEMHIELFPPQEPEHGEDKEKTEKTGH